MKVNRLFNLTIYLLNNGKTSAQALANRFQVSKRTIQRDIDTLSASGVPIVADIGLNGGYYILENYKLNNKMMDKKDYTHVITALKGLSSAFNNQKIDDTLEKFINVNQTGKTEEHIFLDLAVLKEDEKISNDLQILNQSIIEKKKMSFHYTNATGKVSLREVEPIAVTYKWYAWYLFAYCAEKADYRLFKIVRMSQLEMLEETIEIQHNSTQKLLDDFFSQDGYQYLMIKLFCKAEAKVLAMEYLNGKIISELENGDVYLEIKVVENERLWFSFLLGFGDLIKVIEPSEVVSRIKETAAKIIKQYA